ncbi:MAG: hypothetical protein PHU53_03325 [Thermoplasmata archaeon]|nr:hypothetical protein [Thermoplasmata archaeon]
MSDPCECRYCRDKTLEMRNYERYLNELEHMKIDNSFDIPYFAGYSRDGTCIYIDNDVPRMFTIKGREINLHMSLAMHEHVEKGLVDKGYTYAGAHEIATRFEKLYVMNHGIAWADYDHEVGKMMHANWFSRWKTFPVDLDMTPYQYARDVKTLSKMRHYLMK